MYLEFFCFDKYVRESPCALLLACENIPHLESSSHMATANVIYARRPVLMTNFFSAKFIDDNTTYEDADNREVTKAREIAFRLCRIHEAVDKAAVGEPGVLSTKIVGSFTVREDDNKHKVRQTMKAKGRLRTDITNTKDLRPVVKAILIVALIRSTALVGCVSRVFSKQEERALSKAERDAITELMHCNKFKMRSAERRLEDDMILMRLLPFDIEIMRRRLRYLVHLMRCCDAIAFLALFGIFLPALLEGADKNEWMRKKPYDHMSIKETYFQLMRQIGLDQELFSCLLHIFRSARPSTRDKARDFFFEIADTYLYSATLKKLERAHTFPENVDVVHGWLRNVFPRASSKKLILQQRDKLVSKWGSDNIMPSEPSIPGNIKAALISARDDEERNHLMSLENDEIITCVEIVDPHSGYTPLAELKCRPTYKYKCSICNITAVTHDREGAEILVAHRDTHKHGLVQVLRRNSDGAFLCDVGNKTLTYGPNRRPNIATAYKNDYSFVRNVFSPSWLHGSCLKCPYQGCDFSYTPPRGLNDDRARNMMANRFTKLVSSGR